MAYSINQHKHNFAVWAAATAASASPACRFKVKTGRTILESCGFTADFTLKHIPEAGLYDTVHAEWRNSVIKAAKKTTDFLSRYRCQIDQFLLEGEIRLR